LGYVFAGSEYKADVERSFHAIGHGLLIPLFFIAIGLSSDYRALSGHWMMLAVIFVVAVIGKLVGCGMAAMASGMDWVRSMRIGCGMISRGEVGLIVTAMGASSGIFGRSEVAVMVAVVLLTTLITPLALRATFNVTSKDDEDEELAVAAAVGSIATLTSELDRKAQAVTGDSQSGISFRTGIDDSATLLAFPKSEPLVD
jgi:Kef-type K+ transport system membrane component KefB